MLDSAVALAKIINIAALVPRAPDETNMVKLQKLSSPVSVATTSSVFAANDDTLINIYTPDLRTAQADKGHAAIKAYCYSGKPNLVNVSPIRSEKTLKHVLAAILNPAHEGEKDHKQFHNGKWEKSLLGQDLQSSNPVDIFEGLDVRAKVKEWQLKLNKGELSALDNRARTSYGLALTVGCFRSGETFLNIVTAMHCIFLGKKVNIYSSSNQAVDIFVTKLIQQLEKLEASGIVLTDKQVVRYYAQASEERHVRHENTKHLGMKEDPKTQRFHYADLPNLLAYVQAAYDLLKNGFERRGHVNDRRYKFIQHSMGSLILEHAESPRC